MGLSFGHLSAALKGNAWLDGGAIVVPPGHPGLDSRFGRYPLDRWPPPDGRSPMLEDEVEAFEERWLGLGLDPRVLLDDTEEWREAFRRGSGWHAMEALTSGNESFLIDTVPVPPPQDRPMETRLGGMQVPGVFLNRLVELFHHSYRLRRLIELNAPQIVTLYERTALLLAFYALFEESNLIEKVDELPLPGGCPPTEPIMTDRAGSLFEVGQIRAVAFYGDNLLLDFVSQTVEINPEGTLLRSWSSPYLTLVG
ncbi:MAG: hypothetical protein KC561_21225, partial [Myxococcales bacterium]|nr:hypothetical protein [Myxococcales bacterium]